MMLKMTEPTSNVIEKKEVLPITSKTLKMNSTWYTMVSLVTYTEGIPEFLQKIRIHSVYVKEASHLNLYIPNNIMN